MSGPNHNSHSEKFFTHIVIGFISLIAFVFTLFYAFVELKLSKYWYFWAGIAAFLLVAGVYFCMSAFVHKVKSDFNRRAKQREQHRTFMADN